MLYGETVKFSGKTLWISPSYGDGEIQWEDPHRIQLLVDCDTQGDGRPMLYSFDGQDALSLLVSHQGDGPLRMLVAEEEEMGPSPSQAAGKNQVTASTPATASTPTNTSERGATTTDGDAPVNLVAVNLRKRKKTATARRPVNLVAVNLVSPPATKLTATTVGVKCAAGKALEPKTAEGERVVDADDAAAPNHAPRRSSKRVKVARNLLIVENSIDVLSQRQRQQHQKNQNGRLTALLTASRAAREAYRQKHIRCVHVTAAAAAQDLLHHRQQQHGPLNAKWNMMATASSVQQCLSPRPQRERREKENAGDKQRREPKSEELYQVEAVIGERTVHRGGESMTQVLVLWHDYGIEDASWEPILNIPSEFVDRYKGGELPDPDFFDDETAGEVGNARGGDEDQERVEEVDKVEDQGHAPQSQHGEEQEEEEEASSTRHHGVRHLDEEDNDYEEDGDYSMVMNDADKDSGTAGSEGSADRRGTDTQRRSQVAALFVGEYRQHEACLETTLHCKRPLPKPCEPGPGAQGVANGLSHSHMREHTRARAHTHTHT